MVRATARALLQLPQYWGSCPCEENQHFIVNETSTPVYVKRVIQMVHKTGFHNEKKTSLQTGYSLRRMVSKASAPGRAACTSTAFTYSTCTSP